LKTILKLLIFSVGAYQTFPNSNFRSINWQKNLKLWHRLKCEKGNLGMFMFLASYIQYGETTSVLLTLTFNH